MTLNEWEQSNIEVLTSQEMGEWLCRRENRLLDKIRADIEAIIGEHNLDDYDFCSGLICARKIIDNYRDKEQKNE